MASYRSYSPVIGYSGHIPGEKWRVGSGSRERHAAYRGHPDYPDVIASPTGDKHHPGLGKTTNTVADASPAAISGQHSIHTNSDRVSYDWANNALIRQSRSSIRSANHHVANDYGNEKTAKYFRRPPAATVDALDAELRNFELTEERVRRALAKERADLQRRYKRRHYYDSANTPPHTILVDREIQTDNTSRPIKGTVANGYGSSRHYDRFLRAGPFGGEFGVQSPVTLSDISESRLNTVDFVPEPAQAVHPQPKPRHKSVSGVNCCRNAPKSDSVDSTAAAAAAEDAAWTEGQRAYHEAVARRDGASSRVKEENTVA